MTCCSTFWKGQDPSTRSPQITIHKLKVTFLLRPSRCLSIGKSVACSMATQKMDAAEFRILTPRDFKNCAKASLLLFARQFNKRNCPDVFAGLTGLHLQNISLHVKLKGPAEVSADLLRLDMPGLLWQ